MKIFDTFKGLVNELSGLGGIRDKGAHGTWTFMPISADQAEQMYRSNWMARKAVDIPAYDSFRAGWSWQGVDAKIITEIENGEKAHNIVNKAMQALMLGRLFGGGALYLSDGNSIPSQPLNVTGKDGLKFIKVLSRYELQSHEIDQDPLSATYLEPTMYQINTPTAGAIDVHPSRIVRFYGNRVPRPYNTTSDQWSDSVLDTIEIAIRDATAGQQGIASLIQEAKLDIIKIKGFMNQISNERYRSAVVERMQLANMLKSMTNALVMDGEDTFETKTVNFGGLDNISRLQLQVVSGAADIPATRFLSQAPQGMNSTGDGDLRNYYDRISSDRELKLREPLSRVLDLITISQLGSKPKDLWFSFNPLWELSAKEKADIAKVNADSTNVIYTTGLLPREVLGKSTITQMSESGNWPGLDNALAEFGGVDKIDFEEDDTTEPLEDDVQNITDATPKSLYVSRKVLNAQEILNWAADQGFETTLEADDLHVTVMYSRTAIDWMKAGQDYWNEDGTLIIPPGGPRVVSQFDGGAIVVEFSSASLAYRHMQLRRIGAESSYDEYSPHITIAYSTEMDISKIEPYRGKIKLGPEIFAEVNEDWKKEKGLE